MSSTASPSVNPARAPIGHADTGEQVDPTAAQAASIGVVGQDQLVAYANRRQDAVLARVWTFDVAAPGETAHPVTTRLDARGQASMMKLALWLQLNAGNTAATSPYSNVDNTPDTLTFAEVDALVVKAGALDTQSYAILNRMSAGIAASPPTVTTLDQIDAAFAALTPAA